MGKPPKSKAVVSALGWPWSPLAAMACLSAAPGAATTEKMEVLDAPGRIPCWAAGAHPMMQDRRCNLNNVNAAAHPPAATGVSIDGTPPEASRQKLIMMDMPTLLHRPVPRRLQGVLLQTQLLPSSMARWRWLLRLSSLTQLTTSTKLLQL